MTTQPIDCAQLAPFTAADGENLALYEWQRGDAGNGDWMACKGVARAVVLIVHGLGEHAGRYDTLARQLTDWGFAVRAYDQRGHGMSGGERGAVPHDSALLDDLAEVVDFCRARCKTLLAAMASGRAALEPPPLILLGHSLGGLVASRFVALNLRPVEGLVLSSPALNAGLGPVQKLALAVAQRVAPALRVPNGLNSAYLSHDPDVVRRYAADPLVHNKISARLAGFIAHSGAPTVEAAAHWRTPTLLMYAGADRLVNPAGSRDFAARAAAGTSAGMVRAHCFEPLWHELFNELDPAPVFSTLKTWLDDRFPA